MDDLTSLRVDSMSDSSKPSRKLSATDISEGSLSKGPQPEILFESNETDKGLLESYTKIWQSFGTCKDSLPKFSKSPNIAPSNPLSKI